MAEQNITITLSLVTNNAENAIESLNQKLTPVQKSIERVNVSLKKNTAQINDFSKSWRSLYYDVRRVSTVMGTMFASGLMASGFATLIRSAADAQENFAKFNIVFKNTMDIANKGFKDLHDNYRVSQNAAKKMLGDTANLLIGFGMLEKDATKLSVSIQTMASDLATFTNYAGRAEGASVALTKAIYGRREMAKQLGLAISESAVKERMAALVTQGFSQSTEKATKALATYQIMQEQSAKAYGNTARESAHFYARLDALKASLQDLGLKLGGYLIEPLSAVIDKLKSTVDAIAELPEGILRLGTYMTAASAGLVGLGAAGLGLSVTLETLGSVFNQLLFSETGLFGETKKNTQAIEENTLATELQKIAEDKKIKSDKKEIAISKAKANAFNQETAARTRSAAAAKKVSSVNKPAVAKKDTLSKEQKQYLKRLEKANKPRKKTYANLAKEKDKQINELKSKDAKAQSEVDKKQKDFDKADKNVATAKKERISAYRKADGEYKRGVHKEQQKVKDLIRDTGYKKELSERRKLEKQIARDIQRKIVLTDRIKEIDNKKQGENGIPLAHSVLQRLNKSRDKAIGKLAEIDKRGGILADKLTDSNNRITRIEDTIRKAVEKSNSNIITLGGKQREAYGNANKKYDKVVAARDKAQEELNQAKQKLGDTRYDSAFEEYLANEDERTGRKAADKELRESLSKKPSDTSTGAKSPGYYVARRERRNSKKPSVKRNFVKEFGKYANVEKKIVDTSAYDIYKNAGIKINDKELYDSFLEHEKKRIAWEQNTYDSKLKDFVISSLSKERFRNERLQNEYNIQKTNLKGTFKDFFGHLMWGLDPVGAVGKYGNVEKEAIDTAGTFHRKLTSSSDILKLQRMSNSNPLKNYSKESLKRLKINEVLPYIRNREDIESLKQIYSHLNEDKKSIQILKSEYKNFISRAEERVLGIGSYVYAWKELLHIDLLGDQKSNIDNINKILSTGKLGDKTFNLNQTDVKDLLTLQSFLESFQNERDRVIDTIDYYVNNTKNLSNEAHNILKRNKAVSWYNPKLWFASVKAPAELGERPKNFGLFNRIRTSFSGDRLDYAVRDNTGINDFIRQNGKLVGKSEDRGRFLDKFNPAYWAGRTSTGGLSTREKNIDALFDKEVSEKLVKSFDKEMTGIGNQIANVSRESVKKIEKLTSDNESLLSHFGITESDANKLSREDLLSLGSNEDEKGFLNQYLENKDDIESTIESGNEKIEELKQRKEELEEKKQSELRRQKQYDEIQKTGRDDIGKHNASGRGQRDRRIRERARKYRVTSFTERMSRRRAKIRSQSALKNKAARQAFKRGFKNPLYATGIAQIFGALNRPGGIVNTTFKTIGKYIVPVTATLKTALAYFGGFGGAIKRILLKFLPFVGWVSLASGAVYGLGKLFQKLPGWFEKFLWSAWPKMKQWTVAAIRNAPTIAMNVLKAIGGAFKSIRSGIFEIFKRMTGTRTDAQVKFESEQLQRVLDNTAKSIQRCKDSEVSLMVFRTEAAQKTLAVTKAVYGDIIRLLARTEDEKAYYEEQKKTADLQTKYDALKDNPITDEEGNAIDEKGQKFIEEAQNIGMETAINQQEERLKLANAPLEEMKARLESMKSEQATLSDWVVKNQDVYKNFKDYANPETGLYSTTDLAGKQITLTRDELYSKLKETKNRLSSGFAGDRKRDRYVEESNSITEGDGTAQEKRDKLNELAQQAEQLGINQRIQFYDKLQQIYEKELGEEVNNLAMLTQYRQRMDETQKIEQELANQRIAENQAKIRMEYAQKNQNAEDAVNNALINGNNPLDVFRAEGLRIDLMRSRIANAVSQQSQYLAAQNEAKEISDAINNYESQHDSIIKQYEPQIQDALKNENNELVGSLRKQQQEAVGSLTVGRFSSINEAQARLNSVRENIGQLDIEAIKGLPQRKIEMSEAETARREKLNGSIDKLRDIIMKSGLRPGEKMDVMLGQFQDQQMQFRQSQNFEDKLAIQGQMQSTLDTIKELSNSDREERIWDSQVKAVTKGTAEASQLENRIYASYQKRMEKIGTDQVRLAKQLVENTKEMKNGMFNQDYTVKIQ